MIAPIPIDDSGHKAITKHNLLEYINEKIDGNYNPNQSKRQSINSSSFWRKIKAKVQRQIRINVIIILE